MPNLYGVHDLEGKHLPPQDGWCLSLIELSKKPQGINYLAERGDINWIVRANWGYGSTGTIPLPQDDGAFLSNLTHFLAGSKGIHAVTIGNETNMPEERPNGQEITPQRYAQFYNSVVSSLAYAFPDIRFGPAAPAPYRADPPWHKYYAAILSLLDQNLVDDLFCHAYARGSDPSAITDTKTMDPPLTGLYYGFLTYRDFMAIVPKHLKNRPVHITEFDEYEAWVDQDTGIVQAAYNEIDWWNKQPNSQKVRSLILYRFPKHDKWFIEGKNGVINDFQKATKGGHGTYPYDTHLPSTPNNPTTPAPTPTPPPSKATIDPRATERGVTVEATPQAEWVVDEIRWFNQEEADRVGPDHHILVDTVDENGQRVTGVPVVYAWPTGANRVQSEAKPGELASSNFPMTPGEYSVRIGDSRSETVRGIEMGSDEGGGFNPGHHTSTYVRFKKAQPKRDEGVVIPEPQPERPNLSHPVENPAYRTVTQSFGENPEDYARFGIRGHNGIDFATPVGSRIVAVDDGKVAEAQEDPEGYGKYVKLIHTWGESLYAHLSVINVMPGEVVEQGGLVGLSGWSGNVYPPGPAGAHLHFAIRIFPYNRGDGIGGFSDPAPYLNGDNGEEPETSSDIEHAIRLAAKKSGLDFELLASLAWAESSWRPGIHDGLFQVSEEAWSDVEKQLGPLDRDDVFDQAMAGAHYLKWLLGIFDGNLDKALTAYNFGVGNVLDGVAPPAITLEYVNKVKHGRDLLKALEV